MRIGLLKFTSIFSLIAAGVFLHGATAQAMTTNLVVNGDFSTPDYNGGWGFTFGGTSGWSNYNNSDEIEIGAYGVYGIPGMGQNLEVNASDFGDVYQNITGLTTGDKYNLTWSYAGRNSGGPQKLNVDIGNSLAGTDTGSIGTWTVNHYVFTAAGTSEILQFASVNIGGDPSYGNEITNVSISAVPEPATWAMMLVGFAGLGFAGYGRTRKRASTVAAA